jgi:oxaloacetate decarboxylase beta subunit
LLDPVVLKLLLLGCLALLLSGIGGIIGGYALYFWYKGKYNPMIGIAGVSCVPTTAKVVQKLATEANPGVMIMPHALGANISGVITTAILTGIYVALLR